MRSKKALYNILSNMIMQFIAIIYGFIVPKIIIIKDIVYKNENSLLINNGYIKHNPIK